MTATQPRPKTTTPSFLNRIRLAAVITMLLLGIAASWLVVSTKQNLSAGASYANLYVQTVQARSALQNADIAAAGALAASGSAQAEQRQAYDASLREASALVTTILSNSSDSDATLATVHWGYSSYVRQVETALTLLGRDNAAAAKQVGAASSYLRDTLDPALATLGAANAKAASAQLGAEANGWIAPMAIGALAILITLSVLLALRTHRYVNLGMALAAATVVGMWALASSTIGGLTTVGSGAAVPNLARVNAIATVQNQVGQARADELQALIPGLDAAAKNGEMATLLATAQANAAQFTPSVTGYDAALLEFVTATKTVQQLQDGGKATEAAGQAITLAGPKYTAADDTLSSAVVALNTKISTTLNGNDLMLYGTAAGLMVLALVGTLAAAVGVGQRVREYR